MKFTNQTILQTVSLAALALAATVQSDPAKPSGKATIQTLAWLAGHWSSERNGRTTTEIWMPPDGGTMMGMSRTVAQGRTVEYEFMLLRRDASRDIFYVAKPSRQPEASFKLIRATATEAVFENPQHDFPQQISYTLKPDGSLLAATDGEKDGKEMRAEFLFRKTP